MGKTIHLCTIFDSNYLDKGLTLYYSLENTCRDFVLYIFAFDDLAEKVLNEMGLEKVKVIRLEQFETKELLAVKGTRSRGEYCWTCTPVIIEYVLDHFEVECCTYIDADLFFYQSPQILLEEFYSSGKSVGLVEHRFPHTRHGKERERRNGKYCVQFNTFANDEKGRELLAMWRLQCLQACSLEQGGDQLYLTDWGERYEQVLEYQHIGGGVAPWNMANYSIKGKADKLSVLYKGRKYELIFYHFQNIQYSDDGRVKINLAAVPDGGLISRRSIRKIYYPYLYRIEMVRDELEAKYHLNIYKDGIGRQFKLIVFNFREFRESFWRKLRKESVWSAIDLTIRVFRKKDDIIDLRDVRDRKGCR